MDEKATKLLEKLGITVKEGETKLEDDLSQMAEKQDAAIPTGTATDAEVESLKAEIAKLESLAKDGEAFRKEVIEDAVKAGVQAQGNDFPADTWKDTFAAMSIEAIRDIAKTFQKQAEAQIPAGRMSDPQAGKTKVSSLPEEAFQVGQVGQVG